MPAERAPPAAASSAAGPAGHDARASSWRVPASTSSCSRSTRDFLRDFRGDTIHPSTLEIMARARPARRVPEAAAPGVARVGAFGGARVHARRFLAPADPLQVHRVDAAVGFPRFPRRRRRRRYPTFHLRMQAEVVRPDRVGRPRRRRARRDARRPARGARRLVVGCDGRHSTVRARAGLAVEDFGAPMDVLWFRLPKTPSDPDETVGRFDAGRIFVCSTAATTGNARSSSPRAARRRHARRSAGVPRGRRAG